MTWKNCPNKIVLVVAYILGNYHVQAADFGLEYETEWHTDFKGGFNWVNLLKLSATVPVSQHLSFEASSNSIAKTHETSLIDDLQGFSNIEEENLPFALGVLGANISFSRSTVFVGIRNVNEDFFTSPVTSFFLNSSCGIFPTLSCNYDIANYPLASLGIHYAIELNNCKLQTALYNGRGYNRFTGKENVFRFAPVTDGVFSITSSEYVKNGSNYNLGCAIYYGMCDSYEVGGEEASAPSPSTTKKVSVAPWVNIEQRLSQRWHLLMQCSIAAPTDNCRYYCGVGATYSTDKFQLGLFTDYTKFIGAYETATELTCKLPITDFITLQPCFELICTDGRIAPIGLMRVSISF